MIMMAEKVPFLLEQKNKRNPLQNFSYHV